MLVHVVLLTVIWRRLPAVLSYDRSALSAVVPSEEVVSLRSWNVVPLVETR